MNCDAIDIIFAYKFCRLLQPARALYEGVSYSALLDDDDSGGEETELFNVNRASRPRENLVERVLQPGDTLQSIALQYHVSVSITAQPKFISDT